MKYFERKRRERLYRQWVERAGLPADAVPPEVEEPSGHKPAAEDASSHRPFGTRFRPHSELKLPGAGLNSLLAGIDRRLLYGLLIVVLVLFWFLVIVLVVNTCSS